MKITAIYKTKSPLSHIKESVSNFSSFNQIKIFDDNNELIEIPVISGNSVRGALRNAGSEYLLTLLNKKVSKPVFHLLFSGGAISSSINNDVDKAKEIRSEHPFVSLFGGAVCDMMLSGKMSIGNLYPIVKETKNITKIDSNISYKRLLSEIQSVKTDDSKDDIKYDKYIKEEYSEDSKQQMIYETEYLTIGTQLYQEIILKQHCSELEIGAFIASLWNWLSNEAVLGGKSNVGFGAFEAVFNFQELGKIIYEDSNVKIDESLLNIMNKYTDFLKQKNSEDYFDILESKNKPARKK